jgi:hypothetical protein
MRRRCVGLVLLVLLAGGCMQQLQEFFDPDANVPATRPVSSSSFGTPGPSPSSASLASYTKPSTDTALALRVERVGRQLVVANPQIGLEPVFATYGSPKPEIFHQGLKVVSITDSLAKACQSDGQLAAVLAVELGKMAAERQAAIPASARGSNEPLPIDVPMGNAGQVGFGGVDQAHMAELARYEKRRQAAQQVAMPDPQVLALTYLKSAGYAPTELEAARPLLQSAAGNYGLEKQVNTATTGGWIRHAP